MKLYALKYPDGTLDQELLCPDEYVKTASTLSINNRDWDSMKNEGYSVVRVKIVEKKKKAKKGPKQQDKNYQAPGVYSINRDGQPKNPGKYAVLFLQDDESSESCHWNGISWIDTEIDSPTAFGNSNTHGERYIVEEHHNAK